MAYVALYRAYRPQTFTDVAGQKHIVKTLQNAITLNKVAHAYLFCGPRGTGKTSLAKIIAKALNCENLIDNEPCNTCQTCIDINKSRVTDVIEIDAASNNGVDEIRELRDKVKYPPINKFKVYIIDEVHMLTTAAFNALLKTLEEPPKNTIFILATTEVHKIPATILSRCQRFDFLSITSKDVYERLQEVCSKEGINIQEEALQTISEVCEGGLRDALSLLDQCLSFSSNEVITLQEVLSVSGNINKDHILNILLLCIKADIANCLKLLNEVIDSGKEITKIVNDMIIFLRDALLYKANAHDSEKQIFNSELFTNFVKLINTKLVYSYLNILNEAQNNMRFSTQKRAFLELALLSMSDCIFEDEFVLHEKITLLEDKVDLLQKDILRLKENKVLTNDNVISQDNAFDKTRKDIPRNDEVTSDFDQEIDFSSQVENFSDVVEYINIQMIEDILNNGDKDKKRKMQNALSVIRVKQRTAIVEILTAGDVAACNKEKALIVLDDESSCNRTMKAQNYSKLINLINKDEYLIDEFYCIPKYVWDQIKKDYTKKYKVNKDHVFLDNILIPVRKPVKETNSKAVNSDFEELINMFDKTIVEIKENE